MTSFPHRRAARKATLSPSSCKGGKRPSFVGPEHRQAQRCDAGDRFLTGGRDRALADVVQLFPEHPRRKTHRDIFHALELGEKSIHLGVVEKRGDCFPGSREQRRCAIAYVRYRGEGLTARFLHEHDHFGAVENCQRHRLANLVAQGSRDGADQTDGIESLQVGATEGKNPRADGEQCGFRIQLEIAPDDEAAQQPRQAALGYAQRSGDIGVREPSPRRRDTLENVERPCRGFHHACTVAFAHCCS
jgi:hypothetical protein